LAISFIAKKYTKVPTNNLVANNTGSIDMPVDSIICWSNWYICWLFCYEVIWWLMLFNFLI